MGRVGRWVTVAIGVGGCFFCASTDWGNWIAWLFGLVFLVSMLIVVGEHR